MIKRRHLIKSSLLGLAGISAGQLPVIEIRDYNILSLGGIPDGRTLNTKTIQQAIDSCSAQGGGRVHFPPGKYLTGALILKSGVELYLSKGARILGSTNEDDYFLEEMNTGTDAKRRFSLVNAIGQKDISINGEGSIDGQGGAFPHRTSDNQPKFRPNLIHFRKCENVKAQGIFLTDSGAWMQHYYACKNVQISGIRVYNHCNYNNDGIDINGCRDVTISNCIIDSDDDAICLKSTGYEICENVVISNCVARSFCNAIKLGTESIGGFRNVVISNCTVTPCDHPKKYYGYELGESAISVEMVDGGTLEQVTISHITVKDTGCPIFIRLGNRGRKPSTDAPNPGVGTLRNVRISHITATTTSPIASSITGIEGHDAEGLFLDNITLRIESPGKKEFSTLEVPENDPGYPTARMFGKQLPAAAFFLRHVRNLYFSNLHISIGKDNFLPAFVLDDVKNTRFLYPELETVNSNELLQERNCSRIQVVGNN